MRRRNSPFSTRLRSRCDSLRRSPRLPHRLSAKTAATSTASTHSTTQFPTYDNNHVSGLFYADLNITQKFDINGEGRGEFFINVTNVFDRWPLLVPETGLAANSTYSDMLGRAFRIGFRVQTN